MNEGLVSVVVPTYNHAHLISDAIQSVVSQTYENWEMIIVNNFSDDNTEEVVSSFQSDKIRLVNFANKGIIASSRNKGIRESKGEYIAFLDSDDAWKPDKLKKQVNLIKESGLDVVSTNAFKVFDKQPSSCLLNKPINKEILSFSNISKRNYIIQSSVLLKKSLIDRVGYISEDPDLVTIEDFDFWIRILDASDKSVAYLPEPLVAYRIHNSNSFKGIKAVYNKVDRVLNKYLVKRPIDIIAAKTFRTMELLYSYYLNFLHKKKMQDGKS